MHLRSVRKGAWTVYEVCDDDGTSPLLAWHNELNKKYSGSFKRLFAIIRQVSETPHGPTQLSDEISHEVNKNDSIYEFIAGDLRLFWFYSPFQNKIIICSCHHIKKGKKANKQEVSRIIKIKKNLAKAHKAGKIEYFDEEGRRI